MTRIDPTFRKLPVAVERFKQLISRKKRPRMDRDQEYNAVSDIYKEENPYCVRCGSHFEIVRLEPAFGLQTDHIVGGTAGRDISLLNSDSWINQCPTCHPKAWDIAEKIAAKLLHIIDVIEALRGRAMTSEQNQLILNKLKERLS